MDDSPISTDLPLVSNDNHLSDKDGDAAVGAGGVGAGRDETPSVFGTPQLVELFADFRDAGVAGFALAQVPAGGRILWVQERMAMLETGRPFGQGLAQFGGDPDQLVLACSRNAADLLWAMEEGLKCSSLSAIIGEIYGDPRALDFTATKRLATRAERCGVRVFLIRFQGQPDLSAARQRWRIASLPSTPHPYDPKAPGAPRWQAELFRARDVRPGIWNVSYDRAAHRIDLAAPLRNPALDEPRRSAAGSAGNGVGYSARPGTRNGPRSTAGAGG